METAPMTSWTLQNEIPIPDDIGPLLVDGLDSLIAWAVLSSG